MHGTKPCAVTGLGGQGDYLDKVGFPWVGVDPRSKQRIKDATRTTLTPTAQYFLAFDFP